MKLPCYNNRQKKEARQVKGCGGVIMSEKVLIPVDSSEMAAELLQYGAWLAVKIEAEICVVHVVEPFSKKATVLSQFKEDMVDQTNELLKAVGEEVMEHAKAILKDTNLNVSYVTKLGYPSDEIIKTAQEEGCTLIVIGCRGMNSLGKLMLGSVSSKVAHDAHIPVLIFRK